MQFPSIVVCQNGINKQLCIVSYSVKLIFISISLISNLFNVVNYLY